MCFRLAGVRVLRAARGGAIERHACLDTTDCLRDCIVVMYVYLGEVYIPPKR